MVVFRRFSHLRACRGLDGPEQYPLRSIEMGKPQASTATGLIAEDAPIAERRYPPVWLSWSIWSIAALFYLAGFYHRVSPAVMTDELMSAFKIGGAGLGNLSAFYFYFYVAMQI